MGLFDRFRRVVTSNINEMISKAENPEKMLTQLIEDMNGQLVESKKAVASAIADEKQLERQLLQQRTQTEDWEKRAVLAVQEGKDDLAKRALVRKQELAEYVSSYQDQWQAQRDSVEQLKGSLRDLTQKIEEAQRKKNILIARAKRAEAQQRIQSTLSTSRDTSAFEAFDRMAKKVDQIEAQADAEREIDELDAGDKALEREFKAARGRRQVGGHAAGRPEEEDGADRGQVLGDGKPDQVGRLTNRHAAAWLFDTWRGNTSSNSPNILTSETSRSVRARPSETPPPADRLGDPAVAAGGDHVVAGAQLRRRVRDHVAGAGPLQQIAIVVVVADRADVPAADAVARGQPRRRLALGHLPREHLDPGGAMVQRRGGPDHGEVRQQTRDLVAGRLRAIGRHDGQQLRAGSDLAVERRRERAIPVHAPFEVDVRPARPPVPEVMVVRDRPVHHEVQVEGIQDADRLLGLASGERMRAQKPAMAYVVDARPRGAHHVVDREPLRCDHAERVHVPPGGDGAPAPLTPQPGESRPVAVTQPAVRSQQGAVQIGDQKSSAPFQQMTAVATVAPCGLRALMENARSQSRLVWSVKEKAAHTAGEGAGTSGSGRVFSVFNPNA